MKRAALVVVMLALLVWGRTALYTVDYAEFVYVTRFGERVAIHDGATDAGLKVKAPWPVDSVQRIDRRAQAFDLPAVESLTRDPVSQTVDKTLSVDAFVTWRIPDAAAAEQFIKTVRTPEQARKILAPLINGRLAAVISTMPLEELISVVDVDTALAGAAGVIATIAAGGTPRAADLAAIEARGDRVSRRLLGEDGPAGNRLRDRARDEYGIEILDVRVRRFSYPEAVRKEIAERIRSERAKKVAKYESDGRVQAARITTDAFAEARKTEDLAAAEKTRVEGQAKADAALIRGTAYAADREFGLFLERLQAFQAMAAETRDLLLLSTKHPLFELLRGPPAASK